MLNDMGRFHHSRAWSFDAGVSYRYGQPVKESGLLQFQCFVRNSLEIYWFSSALWLVEENRTTRSTDQMQN